MRRKGIALLLIVVLVFGMLNCGISEENTMETVEQAYDDPAPVEDSSDSNGSDTEEVQYTAQSDAEPVIEPVVTPTDENDNTSESGNTSAEVIGTEEGSTGKTDSASTDGDTAEAEVEEVIPKGDETETPVEETSPITMPVGYVRIEDGTKSYETAGSETVYAELGAGIAYASESNESFVLIHFVNNEEVTALWIAAERATVLTEEEISDYLQNSISQLDWEGNKVDVIEVRLVEPDPITMIVEETALTVGGGEYYQLHVSFSDGLEHSVRYATSKGSVLAVNQGGLVFGRKKGSATISIASDYGYANVRVKVVGKPKKVKLYSSANNVGVGDYIEVWPGFDKNAGGGVSYYSSDESIAAIESENGKTYVRGISEGAVIVTVVSYNGKRAAKWIAVKPAPESVTLNCSDKYGVGERVRLGYTVSIGRVYFESDAPEVLSVDRNSGNITANTEGVANVTVTTYNGCSDTKVIEVRPAPQRVEIVSGNAHLYVGDRYDFKEIKFYPEGSYSSQLRWYTSKKKIATVGQNGCVYGKKKGKAVITVQTHNGARTAVYAYVYKAPKSIAFTQRDATLIVGDSFVPGVNFGGNYTLYSSDPSVAMINEDGRTVTALSYGRVTLTCVSFNRKRAYMSVFVPKQPDYVELKPDNVVLREGDTLKLVTEIEEDAQCRFEFSSDDDSIVNVDSEGVITAVSAGGPVYVRVETTNEKTDETAVTVLHEPTGIEIEPANAQFGINEKDLQLSWRFGSEDEGGRVSFASSNERVATVDKNGHVEFKGVGTAIISVTTYNGMSDECELQINEQPGSVSFARESCTIAVGDSIQIPVVFDKGRESYRITCEGSAATVNGSKVTGVSEGETRISLTTYSGLTCECIITVKEVSGPLKFTESTIELVRGRNSKGYAAAVFEGFDYVTCNYTSGDPDIVSVDSRTGEITSTGFGSCTIYAEAFNGQTAECEVSCSGILQGRKLGIDPGHQRQQNSSQETVSPNSSSTKMKVTSGTTGADIAEYRTNLTVGLMLRDMWEYLGAEVIMTRTTHDVNISNQQRAKMMNAAGVDLWLRIHCNASSSSSHNGTRCFVRYSYDWGKDVNPNPWEVLNNERRLANSLTWHMCALTGFKRLDTRMVDEYTGNNWSIGPCVLVEMGYDSNKEEARKLNNPYYQYRLAMGMTNAVCEYYGIELPQETLIPEAYR